MGQKLTNEIVDWRLIGRNIKRLDDIISARTKHNWKCLVEKCDCIWKTTPDNILNKKTGCPNCFGNTKLTNEIVDQKLIGRNIRRLDDYINALTKHNWECLIEDCKYCWKTTASSILNGKTNCPNCTNSLKLTNEIVDQKLIGRNIKRLEDYINIDTPIKCQCEIDNYIWYPIPDNLLNKKRGCPKCGGTLKLTNEEVDRRLVGRNIKRLDDIINNGIKHNWECLIEDCSYIWQASALSILNNESGCPKCAGTLKLTNEEVDLRLIDRNIKRLDDIINSSTKHNWQCLIETCQYIWQAIPNSILNTKSGCPKCSFGKNEKLIGSTIETLDINFEYQKNIKTLNNKELRNLRFDYYLNDFNIAIEYNGEQHYEPVCFNGIEMERAEYNFIEQQKRDQYLEMFCKTNSIKLISIDGRKYKDDKLKSFISELIDKLRS